MAWPRQARPALTSPACTPSQDLVARAIAAEGIDMVDLGPSGSDAFSELKQRYGFQSVSD